MEEKILIKAGRVVDPASNSDRILDILIENRKISKVAKELRVEGARTINATNKIVMPGLVDMHVHLRQPGREDKETIESATKAALKGGVTSLLAMPNTNPPIDSRENISFLKTIIKKAAKADVFICSTITKERMGHELINVKNLKQQQVLAMSDDGSSVDNQELMFSALKRAKKEGLLLICHCEDKSISRRGVVNYGFTSTRLGLRGIPRESEYERVARDIRLAKKAKAKIHIAHVSCKESVEIIAAAKKKGVKVTAETAPHYFALNEEATWDFDTDTKMNPPLRSKEDQQAIRQGLKDRVIDVIASDHAPHTASEKGVEFERAEFGVVGLETELSVSITELIETGILSWLELVKKLAFNPAKILAIEKGTLQQRAIADIIIVDAAKEWTPTRANLISKSKNSCFLGKKLRGVVEYTIKNGEVVYLDGVCS